MGFDKTFFDTIPGLKHYFKTFPCGTVTVTVCTSGTEYHVVTILAAEEGWVTFAYYDDKKAVELRSPSAQYPKAWPALSIPYERIEWVEFNPSATSLPKAMGYRPQEQR